MCFINVDTDEVSRTRESYFLCSVVCSELNYIRDRCEVL